MFALYIQHLNSDMMVVSGQLLSSTSSTVEFWSEKEKHLFTFIPKVPSGCEMWALGIEASEMCCNVAFNHTKDCIMSYLSVQSQP